jgi:hypothetical protein
MTTKPPLQKLSKEFCTQKMKTNKTMRVQEIPNHRRRKGRESESNVDVVAQNQTFK